MRQNIEVDPSRKLFEAFVDFSGGLNSEITNERLAPNEFPVMLNADLSGRASARLRYGRDKLFTQAGVGQGLFFYYRQTEGYPDKIVAISGRLYVRPNGSNTTTEIPILDGATPFTFQTTRSIEAVQYKDSLYVATGTKLVEVTFASNVWSAKVVIPYTPTVMEAIYIGTNGLAPNPDAYIQDGVSPSSNVEAIGIKPAFRYAAVNESFLMTAFITVPSGYSGTVDYQWEHKFSSDTTWIVDQAFTAGAKTHTYAFNTATHYDVRVTVRKTGDTTAPTLSQQYLLGDFEVRLVSDRVTGLPSDSINSCTRILLHWDRILLYGDTKYPYQMYISDLEGPRYFPTDNTIAFDIGKQEPITAAVRFQDLLVIFTRTSVQTLVGKSTDDYARFLIHDGFGCIAGWTAKVVGNRVYFLSHEGIHQLAPNPYRLETMNVSRIDGNIKSEVPVDTDACAAVNDSMYWICFPQKSIVYRYYYENNVWIKDKSTKLNINQFLTYGEDVYNLTANGNVYKHNSNVYTDDGELYDMEVETKSHDLSASFNFKKLKRLYLLARSYQTYSSDLFLTVLADSALALDPESGHAEVQADGSVVWVDTTTPNFHFASGTSLGTWMLGESILGEVNLSVQKASIRGKCRRVKLRFRAIGGAPFELFGFGLEFKLKKP